MLADHGIMLPPNMQGLTDEQIEDLKLHDDWADKCKPSGGPVFNVDKIGRRNGQGSSEMIHLLNHLHNSCANIIFNTYIVSIVSIFCNVDRY